jgi:hypothetical protein
MKRTLFREKLTPVVHMTTPISIQNITHRRLYPPPPHWYSWLSVKINPPTHPPSRILTLIFTKFNANNRSLDNKTKPKGNYRHVNNRYVRKLK